MMSTSLPYKRTNPRTVNGAERKGWHVIVVPRSTMSESNVSWLGLNVWAQLYLEGGWVDNFLDRKFAFEFEHDASKFAWQWAV